MIEINILRERQEKFHQKVFLIRIVSMYLIGLLCLLIIVGITYITNRVAIRYILASIKKYNDKISSEQGFVQEVQKFRQIMEDVSRKLFDAQEEYNKRPLWSKKFAVIVSAVPERMWLEKMAVVQNTQGKNVSNVFVIEGSLMSDGSDTGKTISDFMNNIRLRCSSDFSSVSLKEIKKIKKTTSSDIISFRIECGLKGSVR